MFMGLFFFFQAEDGIRDGRLTGVQTCALPISVCFAAIAAAAPRAEADPDPRRKVSVLEYRAGSSALPGIAGRIAAALSRKTSLGVLGQDQTRAIYGDQLDRALVK